MDMRWLLKSKKILAGAAIILLSAGLIASARIAPAQGDSSPEFTGQADIEITSPTVEANSEYQWLITVAGMVITGCIGPVIVSQFKGRADRSEKNLTYAWDNARETQKQLIESKDGVIEAMRDESGRLRAEAAKSEERADIAEKRVYQLEQENISLSRRLRECEKT